MGAVRPVHGGDTTATQRHRDGGGEIASSVRKRTSEPHGPRLLSCPVLLWFDRASRSPFFSLFLYMFPLCVFSCSLCVPVTCLVWREMVARSLGSKRPRFESAKSLSHNVIKKQYIKYIFDAMWERGQRGYSDKRRNSQTREKMGKSSPQDGFHPVNQRSKNLVLQNCFPRRVGRACLKQNSK